MLPPVCQESKLFRLCRRTWIKERGIALPIGALFLGAILFYMIALGIDTALVKRVRIEAQEKLDFHCRLAAEELPIVRRVVEQIGHGFGTLQGNLPAEISGAAPFSAAAGDLIRLILPSPGSSSNTFYSLAAASSTLPTGMEILADVGLVGEYPAGYWIHDESFGGKLGCEMQIRAQTFLSGTFEVRARSVWRQHLRGGPGIAVVLAPEVATLSNGSVARFRFYNQTKYEPYNPLTALQAGVLWPPFNYGSQPPLNLVGYQNGSGLWLQSELVNQLVACSSPLGAARGMILSSIIARLARWDEARMKTLFLIANPAHLDASGQPIIGSNISGHVEVVPYGNDLAASIIPIPTVEFQYVGGTGSVAGTSANTALEQRVAQQWRHCYHLFYHPTKGAILPLDPKVSNVDMQQSITYEPAEITPDSTPAPTYAALSPWGPVSLGGVERLFTAEELAAMPVGVQNNASGQFTNYPNAQTTGGLFDKELPKNARLRGDLLGVITSLRNRLIPGGSLAGVTIRNLLLVTHFPPDPADIAALRALVLNDPIISEMLITVIYMPSQSDFATVGAVNRMRRSFMPLPGSPEPLPYNVNNYTGTNLVLYYSFGDNDDQKFRNLWNNMLDPDHSYSASKIARNIFLQRIAALRVNW